MKKNYCFLLICILCLFGCEKSNTAFEKYSEQMFDAGFDTVITLIAYTEDEATFETYQKRAKELFMHYHQLFDRYQSYEGVQNVKTINDQAGIAPVKVDQELLKLIQLTKQYGMYSAYQYDVTYGAVFEIWHDYRNNATQNNIKQIPSMKELEQAKIHTGWEHVIIDEEASTIYIDDSDASIDLGSAAKGYACEQVAKQLESEGLSHAIINAGGNVRIIGEKPDGTPWNVGIQLPSSEQNSSIANVLMDKDVSFVTSGDYQRAYEVDGKLYHHIIDPHTLMPATYMRSVTLITKDSGIADILSTTLFTMSYEQGNALLEQLKKDGMDVDAIWVFDETLDIPKNADIIKSGNYQLIVSDGIKDQVEVK